MRNILICLFVIILSACGNGNETNLVTNDHLIIESIQISSQQNSSGTTKDWLPVGFTLPFKAIANYADGSQKDISQEVKWHSSVNSVVEINSVGLAKGTSQGVSRISASLASVKSNQIEIVVTSAIVTELQVSAAQNSFPIGTQSQLSAIATFSDGSAIDVTTQTEWSSSDNAIVSVSDNGLANGLKMGASTVSGSITGVTSNALKITITDAVAAKLQISPASSSIAMGTSAPFTAILTFTDGKTQDVSQMADWSSSSTDIVTINPQGVAIGVSKGGATISASYQGIDSNNAILSVTDATITRIQVTPANLNLPMGLTEQLVAIALFSDGSRQDISTNVQWLSSESSIVEISDIGLLKALTMGSSVINARLDGVTSNGVVVNVSSAMVTKIQISPAKSTISMGTSTQFSAVATFSDSTTRNVTNQVAWLSDDTNKVLISTSGTASGVAVGKALISATLDGVKSNTATLTVSDATISELIVTPGSLSLPAGLSQQFHAVAKFSDGSSQDISAQVSWQSSDLAVATISSKGVLNAVAKGVAEVTANYNGVISNAVSLKITDATATQLQISAGSTKLAVGTQTQLTATATYSDGSSEDVSDRVSWDNNDFGVLAINATGTAVANGVGIANIQAHFSNLSSNTLTMTITSATVLELQITPAKSSIAVGSETGFTAVATYSDDSSQDVSDVVAWQSSNTSIATVSPQGRVTGVVAGSVIVSASLNGVSSNPAQLLVTDAVVTKLQLSPTGISVAAGLNKQFKAIATFSDNSSQDVSAHVSWNSSNSAVATVGPTGIAMTLASGETTINAIYAGVSSNNALLKVTTATLSTIQLTPGTASIAKGSTVQFTALATFSDGSTQDISTQVSWSSSNTGVATVSTKGVVTAQSIGTSAISATMNGVISNDVNLVVTTATITQLQITPNSITLAKGVESQLTATASYSDGSTQIISSQVAWHSDDTSIATVTNTGVLAGVEAGQTLIQASLDGVRSNDLMVNVSAATVSSLQVTPASSSLAVGTERQFTVIAHFSDNSTKDITNQASWNSTETSVATVVSGLVSANSSGNTSISASFNGVQSNQASLNVTSATMTHIQVLPGSVNLPMGTNGQLQAIASYSDGSSQNISNQVSWSTSSPSVVTVSGSGMLSSVALGSASITASKDGIFSNAVSITVSNAMITGLQITSQASSIAAGTSTQFTAMASYSDGSNRNVTDQVGWNSNNITIVTVDAQGKASGSQAGAAVVTANYQGESSNGVTLTVTAATLDSINISTTLLGFAKGTQSQLSAIGHYSDGSQQDLSSNVFWVSSDTGVATVDENGLVFGVNVGDVTVSAGMSGIQSNDLNLTITAAEITAMTIVAPTNTIALGNSLQFTATASYSDGNIQVVTNQVAWFSSSTSVITIDNKGKAQSVDIGTSNIMASLAGVSSNIVTATVNNAVVQRLRVTMDVDGDGISDSSGSYINLLGLLGNPPRVKAIGFYSDGSVQDVTAEADWHSTDAGLLSVALDSSNVLRLNVKAKVLSHEGLSATNQGLSSENYLDVDCVITVPLVGTSVCTLEDRNF
nr:Ig-like domain-containing protein [Shewanella algae]